MTWWTFAGQKANAALAPALASLTHVSATSDNLGIEFERALPLDAVRQAIEELGTRDPGTLLPTVSPEALEGMKFSDCLPPALAVHVLGMRNRDPMAVRARAADAGPLGIALVVDVSRKEALAEADPAVMLAW